MKRSIEMIRNNLYYRGKLIDYVLYKTRKYFNLDEGKHIITIVEGTQYSLIEDSFKDYKIKDYKIIDKDDCNVGDVCKKHFDKLFFIPYPNKRYDITVKKVK